MKSKILKASPTVVLGILLVYTFIDYLTSDVKIDYRVWIALLLYLTNIILYFFKFRYGVMFTGIVLVLATFMIAKFLPTLFSGMMSLDIEDSSVSIPYLEIRMFLLLVIYIIINRQFWRWKKMPPAGS